MVDADTFIGPWWRERLAALDAAPIGDTERDQLLTLDAVLDAGMVVGDDPQRAAAQLSCMTGDRSARAATIAAALGAEPDQADIHHMHHLWAAGWPHTPQGPIVEWGGGYGNLARLTRRFDPPPPHFIVDLPAVSRLQHAYLGDPPGVTLVTAAEWARHVEVRPSGWPWADTFIANFSLDECSAACHDWIISHDWFGAEHISIAMQPTGKAHLFPDAADLHRRLVDAGFREIPAHVDHCVYMRLDR